jgi:endo-1,4-beta-D-glucanase Y
MSPRSRIVLVVVAVFAVAAAAVAAVGLLVPRPTEGPAAGGSTPLPSSSETAEPEQTVAEAADAFLADWVEDGRVVRHDQGGDTVSEGQAYGLLIALAADDEESFSAIWSWTEDNLQREDGLLAWRWDDGAIVDDEPASDADVDAARALVLAGEAWDDDAYTDAGIDLATTVADTMTVETEAGRILVPGLWAADSDPSPYNPSYASPAAFAVLADATDDARWTEVAAGTTAVTRTLLAQSPLPPDWAQVHGDGRVEPMPGAAGTGQSVRYGYDAARLAVRYAESCEPADRALAAQLAPTLGRTDPLAAELDLGGSALGQAQHPLGYIARAAARASAEDDAGAGADLTAATSLAGQSPTYYGAAWSVLGRAMLESDVYGGCAPMDVGGAS